MGDEEDSPVGCYLDSDLVSKVQSNKYIDLTQLPIQPLLLSYVLVSILKQSRPCSTAVRTGNSTTSVSDA